MDGCESDLQHDALNGVICRFAIAREFCPAKTGGRGRD
jgi:hypothetical protein